MKFETSQPNPVLRISAQVLWKVLTTLRRARRYIKALATVNRFGSRGSNFVFDPDGEYSFSAIHVGDNVNLGTRPVLLATRSEIRIGSHVVLGPGVTIRGGNHRFDLVGKYIVDVGDNLKSPDNDKGVVIEDDVWIGGNATILHGVTIGRGSVVGAAAVVTRSIPPYSIAAGNPCRVIRPRWDAQTIAAHEEILYPAVERIPLSELERLSGPVSSSPDELS